jgi:ABC-type multidrug transport system ATPase subunit
MKNVNLRFEAGKLYLVLGGPASGKSTLLKAVAGLLKEDKNSELSGEISVNGKTRKDKELQWNVSQKYKYMYCYHVIL